jgi:uncharacterized protein YndB with AHSA1/START domain
MRTSGSAGATGWRVDQPDGAVHVFTGEYLELDPPHRIVQTFGVTGPQLDEQVSDEKVTVLFEPAGDGRTTVTIRNTWTSGPWPAEAYDALREGWGLWLDLLAKLYE